MKFLNKVKSVRALGDYRVEMVFTDGYTAQLDLAPVVGGGPVFEALREPKFFAEVGVTDWGVISWPNGADIDSDVLRFWCEQGRVCSREETNAYFDAQRLQPETAAARDANV